MEKKITTYCEIHIKHKYLLWHNTKFLNAKAGGIQCSGCILTL
jgi:hypothetical protein